MMSGKSNTQYSIYGNDGDRPPAYERTVYPNGGVYTRWEPTGAAAHAGGTMDMHPLDRPCSHCNGTGTIRLTRADVGPYGLALLEALHGWTWRATGDLPLPVSELASTRFQALKRLARWGLAEQGEKATQLSGGSEYEWRITASGRALLGSKP